MAGKGSKDKKSGAAGVNKKAYRDYELLEKFEAGLSLVGTEVKSLRGGQVDLSGAYGRIERGECWLMGVNISPYEQAGVVNHPPLRKRKLLLHKSELRKMWSKLEQRGFTLVPLRIYFNTRGLAKVELALARGKRKYDKRETMSKRQQKMDIEREMKRHGR